MKKNENTRMIFLVDDDQLFIEALKHYLSQGNNNIKVETFNLGEACLRFLHLQPDVIVIDYYLNSSVSDAMNGMAILKEIKKVLPDVPVIMLSSQDSLKIATEILSNGAYDYISKSESAFVRIENIISNLFKNIKTADNIDKKFRRHKVLHIVFIALIIILYLLNRIL